MDRFVRRALWGWGDISRYGKNGQPKRFDSFQGASDLAGPIEELYYRNPERDYFKRLKKGAKSYIWGLVELTMGMK